MVVQIARIHIKRSKKPLEAAINDPTIIPDTDKGKVRNRAAFIQTEAFDKIIVLKIN